MKDEARASRFVEIAAQLFARVARVKPVTPPGSRRSAAALAIEHQLAGLLLLGLDRGRLDDDGDGERLRKAARQEAAHHLLVTRERGAVLARLGDAGLRPLVLKGEALALAVWPSPALRPAGDLDLLLPREQLARARAALEAHGYHQSPDSARGLLDRPPVAIGLVPPAPRRLLVDLHHEPFRWIGHRLSGAGLLARAHPLRLDGVEVLALDEADQLLYLAVHTAKHGGVELKWWLDLAGAVALSGERALLEAGERARATQTSRALYSTLSVVAELPPIALPAGFLEGLRPPWAARRVLARAINLARARSGAPATALEHLAMLTALEPSLVERGRMAAALLARAVTSRRS